MNKITGYFVALLVCAGAAAASEEIVQNGGFETGALPPWTAYNFKVGSGGSPGPHSGTYAAGMGYYGYIYEPLTGYTRQDFGKTYSPAEVKSADFWIWPDPRSYGNRAVVTSYEVKLGANNTFGGSPPGGHWYHVVLPTSGIQYPFDYINISVTVYITAELPPYNMQAGLDDISVLISPSGVSPASFGRIKTLFR